MSDRRQNGQSTDSWAFSEFRDWLESRHRRDSHLPQHAGEIDDAEARRTLTAMERAYERAARQGRLPSEAPASIEQTDTYQDLRVALGTETAAHAVEDGQDHVLRGMIGSQDDEPDISGIKIFEHLEEIITDAPLMLYIYGPQGNGKTMLAALCAELWNHWVGGQVASNLRTIDSADDWIERWYRLQDWFYVSHENRLSGNYQRKLYVMDEANAVLGGQGSDGYQAKTKLAALGYKIRHYGGSLIVVGHDGKDIAPSIRELCTIANKTGTKTVRFYDSIKERTPRDPLTPELTGVPMPDKPWQPHTRDDADFRWQEEDGSEPGASSLRDAYIYTAITGMQQDASSREVAKFVPYSHQWVANRYNEWNNEGEHDEVLDKVEDESERGHDDAAA